ncbi:hypothetical protein [Flavobacterium davisii]|uniref:DUF4292 domain-containing protein n=1 Tax=Flavobacterium columnare TaxID=996 RepID=A0A8G0KT80_9FLAO|nr:hypothetical protein [Flavobacterium davisii]QYS89693.1 hypothetical protein JJC05_05465 [Flavobacterium davisii]
MITSILGVFLQGCKIYEPLENSVLEHKEQIILNPYFANPELDYIYKAQIEAYGNTLSGLFIIKKINQNSHRVVMTTDFGNKLLDFTIGEQEVKTNYVIEDLNKKIILKILANDLKLLVQEKYLAKTEREKDEIRVLETKQNAIHNYFYFKKDSNQLIKIVQSTKRKARLSIIFDTKNADFSDQIFLEHYNFNIKINLKQIIK